MHVYPGTWAAKTPDKPALIVAETGRRLTYAELDDRSIRLSRYLHAAGLRRGDVVALLSDNTPETYEVYWAVLRSGLYVTAVNHHLAASEAAYIVDDCGAKALVVSAAKHDLVEQLGDMRVPVRLAFGGDVAGFGSYEEALASSPAEPLPEQPHGDDFLYSSGTTGRPKGVKRPLPDIDVGEPGYPYVDIFGSLYAFGPDTVYLSPAPVYHAAPLRFGGIVHALGGTLVMMRRFDAENALRAIERYRVTHTQMVPTMFVRLLKLPPSTRQMYDVSSLEVVIHAAAPCPVEVKRQMIDWLGPIVHEYYASTEANGATFINSEDWLAHPGSVGPALLGTVRICGPGGELLGPGEVGTIYFERDEVPFGYHNDPEKTAGAQHPEHPTWTTVGDLGYLDADGFLYLTDRVAFMIISGGVNIYPQEVEDLFSLHPKVTDIAVIGLPDEEMGERVVGVVQPAPDAQPGPRLEQELIDYAREHPAHYKAPRQVHFVDELPRTPTGKLVKGERRRRFANSN
jgi:long-chain acyl-CoA synthetase